MSRRAFIALGRWMDSLLMDKEIYDAFTGGGLGDIFICYFRDADFIGSTNSINSIKTFKDKYPDKEVNLFIHSDHPESLYFFKGSELFDRLFRAPTTMPRYNSSEKDYKLLLTEDELYKSNNLYDTIKLNDEENDLCDVWSEEKLAVFHPYSSTWYKFLPENIDKRLIIDTVIDKYGYNVVLIGKTNYTYWGREKPLETVERLDYIRPGLLNLTLYNKPIVKIAYTLTMRASKILAVDSGYIMLSQPYHKVLAFLRPEREMYKKGFEDNHYFAKAWKNNSTIVWFDEINNDNIVGIIERFMDDRTGN